MAVPLPDPAPGYLPPGFVAFPDQALEATGVVLATGPITPVQGPTRSRMRQYVKGPPTPEALHRGPTVRVRVSHAASFPPEWFEGLTGVPVEISGSNGYYRVSGDQASLIVLHEALVVEVTTGGVPEAETLAIARSLNLASPS